MTVTTITKNGEHVTLSDFDYLAKLGSGEVPYPDFVFLFDTTGYAAEPFTRGGYVTLIVDMLNVGMYATNKRAHSIANWDVLHHEATLVHICSKAKLLFGFPPCTDLATSGAKHFDEKRFYNPRFQVEAVHLARSVERIGTKAGVPWAAENPKSVLSTFWRQPNYKFDPYEYGGYLPVDDVHPDYPRFIAPRDAYPKETSLWTSPDFSMPRINFVVPEPGTSRQYRLLGGSSARTKRIRSASPRGFFVALYHQYCGVWSKVAA